MKWNPVMFRYAVLILIMWTQSLAAQDHSHHDHGDSDKVIKPPRVFLDKSPRIVDYQLKRLDNARLLLVETATNDPKYGWSSGTPCCTRLADWPLSRLCIASK